MLNSASLDSGRLDWLDKVAIKRVTLATVPTPTGSAWVIACDGQIITNRASLRDAIDDARKVLHWL